MRKPHGAGPQTEPDQAAKKRQPDPPETEGGRPVESDPDEALLRLEAEDAARAAAGQLGGAAVAEPEAEAIQRLERELGEWKDRALRTAADLENYRKRAAREREEALVRGQMELLARVVEVVDDLARVAHLDPASTTAQVLHDGMLAIERKFLKTLELAGVERIDPAGQPFDPNVHEAVTTQPAPSREADQTVGAVFQHGYRFRGTLLRPARVAVLQWGGGDPPPAA